MAFIGFSQKFNEAWEEWKRYKKEEHGFVYKSEITERKAIKKLVKI